MLLQGFAVLVNLRAGSAEAGDFDDGFSTEMKSSTAWQCNEIVATREDVFADLAGLQMEAEGGEFVQHLGREEVNLCEIRLSWVLSLEVEMLCGRAAVRVAFDAFSGDESQRRLRLLREAVGGAAGCGEDKQSG